MRKLTILLLLAFAAACDGGGSGPQPAGVGTLTIAITDATIDDYDEALLEVSSITIIGSGGQETEVLDTPQIIDLLKLRNVSEVLLRERLLARRISKIRLGVDSIVLNKLDPVDGSITDSDMPPVPSQKVDLNPQGPLEIRAGEDLLITLDVDLKNSIKVNETGNGAVRFRPVVFVNAGVSGLVRLYGRYSEDDNGTSVCDLERVSDADGVYEQLTGVCVGLDETNATYFDVDAMPISNVSVDDLVSVYGYYESNSNGDELIAEIIARDMASRGAAFTTLNGIAATDLAMDEYEMLLTGNTSLPVKLSTGAKVFDSEGVLVTNPPVAPIIAMNQRTEARGAITDSLTTEPDWLQSFVVFVSDENGSEETKGVIAAIDGDVITLDSGPDVTCIVTNANTNFFDVAGNSGEVAESGTIELTDLMEGNAIDAVGDRVGDCIQAETVVRETP